MNERLFKFVYVFIVCIMLYAKRKHVLYSLFSLAKSLEIVSKNIRSTYSSFSCIHITMVLANVLKILEFQPKFILAQMAHFGEQFHLMPQMST